MMVLTLEGAGYLFGAILRERVGDRIQAQDLTDVNRYNKNRARNVISLELESFNNRRLC